MLGRDLLVASVVEQGARSREVYLPRNRGGWYDWHSGKAFAGGETITLDAPLDRLPLLVRAGAVIPLGECESTTDARRDTVRQWQLWPAPKACRLKAKCLMTMARATAGSRVMRYGFAGRSAAAPRVSS